MIQDWCEEIDLCGLKALCMSEFASSEAERRKISARIYKEHEAAVVTTAIRNSTVRRNENSKQLQISAVVGRSCF
jgi:hypothetical protein